MTEIEIAEGNNLITEFEEKEPSIIKEERIDNTAVFREVRFYEMNGLLFRDIDLKYHFDWNWIIPVLEKCLAYEHLKYNDRNELYAALTEINIDSLWRTVVWWLKKPRNDRIGTEVL